MTFYELERKCKERRLKRYLLILGIFLFVIGGGYYFNASFLKKNDTLITHSKNNSIKNNNEDDYLLDDEDEYIFSFKENKEVKEEEHNKEFKKIAKNTNSVKENNNSINKDLNKEEQINIKKVEEKKIIEKKVIENKIKEKENTKSSLDNSNPVTSKSEVVLKPIVPFDDKKIHQDVKSNSNNDNKKENNKPISKKNIPTLSNNVKNEERVIISTDKLPPYDLCIKLANKYLLEGKYKLALKWAKNANIQNNEAPEPWIITAKALYFEGKVDKAKEILRIYLKYNKNREVERILKEMEDE